MIERRFVSGARVALLCLLVGALYAAFKGQDASWDLKNYHLYNAWALLHGRLGVDVAPAGLQSFFNPLPDLPYYLLGTGPLHRFPRVLAGVQGLWFGALVFVVLQIALRLSDLKGRVFRLPDVFAVLIGVTGTMAVSQAGVSSNELPLAVCVLGALYLLLPLTSEDAAHAWRRIACAGLLCGLAAGLKPTAAVYPPALALALAFGLRRHAWRSAIAFSAAAGLGFAMAYGWWGWKLFQLTGNPLFPLFNQVFHSPWVPSASLTDQRFLPRSILQWLFYPFFWVSRQFNLVTETRFADARYAIAMVALVLVALAALFRRQAPPPGSAAGRLVLVFVAAAYLVWLPLFSILRYAIPIEALTGLVVWLAWQRLACSADAPGAAAWGMGVLFVLVLGFSAYPKWGHSPYASSAFAVHVPAVEAGSLIVVMGQPDAYVIPFIEGAADNRYVGLTWLTLAGSDRQLGRVTRTRLSQPSGPVYVLQRNGGTDDLRQALARWLPQRRIGACRPVQSTLEQTMGGTDTSDGLRLCAMTGRGP